MPPLPPISPLPQSSKKADPPYLAIAGVVMAIIIAAGLYFFFYREAKFNFQAPVIAPPPSLSPLEAKVGKISSLPLQVIDSPFYKSLKVYGSLPIVADSLGRTNPFIPY